MEFSACHGLSGFIYMQKFAGFNYSIDQALKDNMGCMYINAVSELLHFLKNSTRGYTIRTGLCHFHWNLFANLGFYVFYDK